jgi:hypothetical protein
MKEKHKSDTNHLALDNHTEDNSFGGIRERIRKISQKITKSTKTLENEVTMPTLDPKSPDTKIDDNGDADLILNVKKNRNEYKPSLFLLESKRK